MKVLFIIAAILGFVWLLHPDVTAQTTTPSTNTGSSVMHVTKKYATGNLLCVESRAVKHDEFARDCAARTDCWDGPREYGSFTPVYCSESWGHKYDSLAIGDQF